MLACVEDIIAAVGPRLRHFRRQRNCTLDELSTATGISISTLSRLESGQRKATLELLLPISRAHRVPLDELVGTSPLQPVTRSDRIVVPLTQRPGQFQSAKMIFDAARCEPDPRTHPGHEWFCVLSGKGRLVLGDHDVVLKAGEVAEFDTRIPHWFGSTGEGPVEILSMFGKQGERIRVRARTR
ncbi:helix-turn-helix domain-containing protein [Streptomyces sp. AA4]|uniref:helix-turn-helix domain-containing protein n=1 Tax=Streptomyces sp. AA4 TaxID=591158 RepID=UPI0001B58C0A|nr:helix-turn-helix transcriptional regulator [Streptomyces sp. AA4]EFL11049.1 transcriptional regulator [Streptomyces sp. AA4]